MYGSVQSSFTETPDFEGVLFSFGTSKRSFATSVISGINERQHMDYRFLDVSAEELMALSELPVENGISVAMRTTGYDPESDEIVELAIVDFEGNTLFSHVVKPQNNEEWDDDDASGGITPADVAEEPELYTFEDEIIELFEKADTVVAPHSGFAKSMIEASWISIPERESFDLVAQFCKTHCTVDYPTQPATAASLEGIAEYYELDPNTQDPVSEAMLVRDCYLRMVQEFKNVREGKEPSFWEAHERELEQKRKNDRALEQAEFGKWVRTTQINAIMWMGAAIIFSNVAVQLHIREANSSLVFLATLAAVFTGVRWIMCLYALYKRRKR